MSDEKGKNGKGSLQRPTNKSKFDENWERIFGKKTVIVTDPAKEGEESKSAIQIVNVSEPTPIPVAVVKYEREIYDLETILDLQEIRKALRDLAFRRLI
jgi:orotate phosphoribosyltransferase-like protein